MANKKKKHTPKPKVIEKKKLSQQNKFILILIAFALILYGNTIPNHFSLDDNYVSAGNEQVKKGISSIPEIFTSFYAEDSKTAFAYRPVVKITYAIEQQFTDGSPHFSHFINMLLYALTLVFLFLVLKRMLRGYNPLIPLLAALVFAAHPAHTEVVASLKNRDELLSFMFAILGFYQVFRYADTRKNIHLLYLGIFYLLGYWSKVSIIIFIVLYPLGLYYFTDLKIKNILPVLAVIVAMSAVCKYLPDLYLPKGTRLKFFFENPLLFERRFSVKVATGLFIMLFYFKQLIFPYPLLFYYGYNMIPVVTFANSWVLFSLLLIIAATTYSVLKIKSKDAVSFFILFILGTLFIYSNIIKQHTGIVADRFINVAVAGFAVLLVLAVFKFLKIDVSVSKIPKPSAKKLTIVFFLILGIYTLRTLDRNKDWDTLFTLMENDIGSLENSAKANSLYGGEMLNQAYMMIKKKGNIPEINSKVELAEKHLKRSLKIYPNNYVVLNNLGTLNYSIKADYPSAIYYFKKAIKEDPFRSSEACYNIAKSYEKMNQSDRASGYFQKAIHFDEDFVEAYLDLGDHYFKAGKMDSAIFYQTRLMEKNPGLELPYLRISKYYLAKKDTVTAVNFMEESLKVNPDNYKLCINLRDYFNNVGEKSKSRYYGNLALSATK